MDRYDVVIVGAGLAGLSCSRWLAERGCKVLLADRKSRLDESIHTTGIFVRRTLEDFSLPDDCLGPAVRDVKLYSPRRRVLNLSSPHDEFRVGKMGPLYMHLLEAAIGSGAQWSPSTSFVRVNDREGTIVELETHGRRRAVRARFLIGADGANSRVARELGLSQNREWIVGVEEVYDSRSVDAEPCLHCFLDPELAPGYIAWLAHDGEELHVGVGGYGNRFDPNACLQRFRDESATYFNFEGLPLVERRGGRIPVGGILPNIVDGRGLLVGDAAGAVSPLTAGGLDPCLRQSALAVQVVSDFLTTAEADALGRYRSLPFKRRFRLRCLMRRGLAGLRSRRMAELAFMGMRTFPLNRLVRHVFFGRGSFPLRESELPATAESRAVG